MSDSELSYGTFIVKKAKKPVIVMSAMDKKTAENTSGNNSDKSDTVNLNGNKTQDKKQSALTDKENQKMYRLALKSQKSVLIKAAKKKKKAAKTLKKAKALARKKNASVKLPIGLKLVGIISVLLILSCVLLIALASYFIAKDTKVSAEDNNLTINTRSASDTENRLESTTSTVSMFYDLLSSGGDSEDKKVTARSFFQRNRDIGGVAFINSSEIYTNRQFFQSKEIDPALFEQYVLQETDLEDKALNGASHVENASPFFAVPVIAMFYPFVSGNFSDVVVVLFSSESLQESYSSGAVNESFMVNDEGQVIIHPDISVVMSAPDYSTEHTVQSMLNDQKSGSVSTAKQTNYRDEDGSEYYSAYRKIKIGNCGVITKVQTDIILEAVNRTAYRNSLIAVAIVAIGIIVVWFFSKSISNPIRSLTEVTDEINKGNFNTSLFEELNGKRLDEIGVLINSTKNEREILNTVTSLTNKGVTKAIIRKEIDFEPHLKDLTIFFSDIRGFTAISDGFNKRFGEKSAGEIIGFLNDYMSRMVSCITLTGGNVDKFEGDAIMACWGVLRDDNLDYEKLPDSNPEKKKLAKIHLDHVKKDAVSAVTAAIAMRYSLMQYNKDAEAFTKAHEGEELAKYKPHIRIGSGLNSGRATVGFMGSSDKMEFTSIGDAVNLASRTESSNKPCGTDLLITEDTYKILKKDFIRCEENNYMIKAPLLPYEIVVEVIPVTFEVKGKGKQHFYGVVNMPNFNIEEFFKKADPAFKLDPDCAKACGPDGPKSLAEVRTLLGIPTPDFSGVNLDEEENKVKVN